MSICRISAQLTALMVAIAFTSSGQAQVCKIDPCNPFIEPNEFAPDYEFFERVAPIDCEEIPGNYGWFATYDRSWINISRPETSLTDYKGDWTFGNRYDIGYMTPNNHGWLATLRHIEGPNVYDIVDVPEFDAAEGDIFPTNTIRLQPSRNFLTLFGIELNKTFRCGPDPHGGVWEPYFGVRYFEIRDFAEQESARPGFPRRGYYVDGESCPDALNAVGSWVTGPTQQSVIRDHYDTRNNLFGGQLGTRVVTQRGRWNLSGDARAFAMENFQWVTRKYQVTVIDYDESLTELGRQTRFCEQSEDLDEFALGMELRTEAAYEVTRDISLRTGFEMIHFFKGIARGADTLQPMSRGGQNSEDLTAFGLTFGVAINR